MTVSPAPISEQFAAPRASFDAEEVAMVLWSRTSEAPEQLFSRRKLNGEDWASLQRFDVPKLSPRSILSIGAFAQSSDGTALVMWTDRKDDANGVSSFSCESSRFTPANGWSRNNLMLENCYADGSVVAANAKGDFAVGYFTPMPQQQLVVVPYFAQNLGATRVVATGPNLEKSSFSLSIGNARAIRAVYFAGTDDHTLYEAEASAQGDWAPVTRIASVPACESDCPMKAVFNQSGDGLAVWQQDEGSRDNPHYSLWSAVRSAQGWTPASKVTPEFVNHGIALALNEHGNAVLAYHVRRAVDSPRELRVRRFNIASGWGDAEEPVGNSPVGEATVGLSDDGHAVLLWYVYSPTGDFSLDLWTSQSDGMGWSQSALVAQGSASGYSLAVSQNLAMVAWQHRATHEIRVAQLD